MGSGRAVNNFSALMKDVEQPWRVQSRGEGGKLLPIHSLK